MPKIGLVFLAVYLLLRLIFWFIAFPNSDEAYYWLWGQHPGLSYYDHPPLQAWIQSVFSRLLGHSNFVLRLPNLFSNAVFLYTYYRISVHLYGQKTLLPSIALLLLASPLYFLFTAFAWHDHLLITANLIASYLWIRFLDSYLVDGKGQSWRLYGTAIALSCAGLSKYSTLFVGIGFVATLVFDRRLRPLFKDWRLYLACAIALCALIPIVLWNFSNDFQSFQYYFNRSVKAAAPSLKLDSCLAFLVTSWLIVSPLHWVGFVRLFKKPPQLESVYFHVAFWVFAVSTAALTLVSLTSTALYYWNINAYLLLFPLLPMVQPWFQLRTQLLGAIVATLMIVHYTVLPISTLVGAQDNDSAMLFGWKDVAAAVKQATTEFPTAPLLMTTDYRSASALAYELNDKHVIAISDRIDQFDFWYRDQQALQGKNAVIVSDDWFSIDLMVRSKFQGVSEPITIPIRRFGVWIKNYYVQKGYHFKP
jgi:4-amino-4-deoxy-L-arabinose transferase-like glycosyltransferase